MNKLLELTSHKQGTSFEVIRDDFIRRYAETYMLLTLKKNPVETLVCISNLNNNNEVVIFTPEGRKIPHSWDEIESLVPWLPKSGYYQLPTRCFYLERRPARQWRRSFNVNLYRIDRMEGINAYDIYEAWKNQHHFYNIDEVDEDSPTIRLSRELACGYSNKSRSLCIFFEEEPIAKVKANKKQISIIAKDFVQEIKDYLTRNNIHHWKLTNE